MSQIRKYNVGGTAQKQIVDEAPMTILGMHFDKETLKNAMLGQQADAYAQHMGFSPEQTKQFKEDLKIRVEEILNGTSYFTDNRELYVPENSLLPSSENLGWEKEKEGKTKSLRNRSIRVTNYLVSYMNDLGFRAERKNKDFYKVNNDRINSIFKDHIKKEGGNEFNQMWLDKDEYDPATKTRKMTNRAKALAEAIQLEIDKLNNDVNYKKGFDYLGQYDTDWNARHSDVTRQLSEIKTTLQDGELTDAELETLSTKYGINFGDNSLLTTKQNIDTDKSVEIQTNYDAQQQEAAEQEEAQAQTQDGWQYHSPFATITPKYSYQGQLYDYDNLPEGVKATAETAMGRSSLASEYNIFNAPYVAWATQGFSGLKNGDNGELIITYSDPIKNEGKKFYYKPKDGNTWQLVKDVTYPDDKQNGSWTISYTDNGGTKTVNLGVWTGEVSPLPTFTPTGDTSKDFYQFKQDVLHNTLLSKEYTERFKINLKKILKKYKNTNNVYYDASKNAIVYKNGNSYIYATIKKDLRENLNNIKLSPENIRHMLEKLEFGEVKYGTLTPYEKQGGILKAQSGMQVVPIDIISNRQNLKNNNKQQQEQQQEQNVSTNYPGRAQTRYMFDQSAGKEHAAMSGIELTNSDYWRLGGAMVDLASVGLSVIPGANLASAAVGAGASINEFVQDMRDLGRDGAQGFWGSLGEFAVNLGMDAVSLIPAGKAAKIGKIGSTLLKYIPHIAGLIQTGMFAFDDQQREQMIKTLGKMSSGDFGKLDANDYNNLAFLGRTLIGANQIKKSVVKPSKTGNNKIETEVTVDGVDYTLSYTAPSNKTTGWKKKNKEKIEQGLKKDLESQVSKNVKAEFEEKLRQEIKTANPEITDADLKIKVNQEIKAKVDEILKDVEIEVPTNLFGRINSEPIRNQKSQTTAKKFGQGIFGYKGSDSWISDYYWDKRLTNRGQKSTQTSDNQKPDETQSDNQKSIFDVEEQTYPEILGLPYYPKQEVLMLPPPRNVMYADPKGNIHTQFPNQSKVMYVDNRGNINSRPFGNNSRTIINPTKQELDYESTRMQQMSDMTAKVRERIQKNKAIEKLFKQNKEKLAQQERDANRNPRTKAQQRRDARYVFKSKESIKQQEKIEKDIQRKKNAPTETAKNKKNREKNAKRKQGYQRRREAELREFAKEMLTYDIRSGKYGNVKNIADATEYNNILNNYIKENRKTLEELLNQRNKERYEQSINKKYQGGILNKKDANFFTLLNSYKSGGSLIPKFQYGGWFDFWKTKYLNEQSLEFNHKGKPYNSNNTLGRTGGVYSNGTVNNNLTAQDIFNKRQEYYDSGKIGDDAKSALDSINSSNPADNIEDLLNSYNAKVQYLHGYKSDATHAYGETGAKDFNSTYNLLYPSSPIGYDESQSDIFGGNTYLRVANSFHKDNDYSKQRNFKYSFNGNDYNIWMDQEGKLNIVDNPTTENQTETRSEEVGNTDVDGQTGVDQEQDLTGNFDLEFAREQKNKGRLNPNSTWFDSLLGVGFAIGSNTAQTKQLLNELDYLRKQTWYNHSPEMRDYVTERLAQINAGKYRSAVKNTSDATINNLAMQGAVSQGNDVISNATAQSQKVYDTSRATNKAYQDANLERSVTNANDNMQRHITNELTKAKLKTDNLATIQTNLNNLLAEFKQNKADLADKEEQAKYQILQMQLQQNMAHNESVTEEIYGKRAKAILLDGVTDEEKIAEINNMDNNKAIEQASGQNSMFKKNYEDYKKKWMLDLYTNYYESIPAIFGSLNMPWIPGRGSKQQNPLITTSFKSGGKLTQSEKERIQRLKDYNKAKLEQAKAFHKKIDKQLDNFHKNHRQSAAGTLRLIEKSLGYK